MIVIDQIKYRITHNSKRSVIWITGFDSVCDLTTIFNSFPKEGVHRGCFELSRELFRLTHHRLHYRMPIVVAGHGLGGAVASALAMRLEMNHYPVEELLTYGSFGISNDPLVYRGHHIVKGFDLYPYLFPWWLNDIAERQPSCGNPFYDHNTYDLTRLKNLEEG